MNHIAETRRAERERASTVSLGGDIAEDTAPNLNLQAAWFAARRPISAAVANVLAEHAGGLIHSRASR